MKSTKFTAVNVNIDKAAKLLTLYGDKTKKSESSQHIIEFPGGAVEVSRTSTGQYWCHIIVNRQNPVGDGKGLTSAKGTIIDSAVVLRGDVIDLPHWENLSRIGILIDVEK